MPISIVFFIPDMHLNVYMVKNQLYYFLITKDDLR